MGRERKRKKGREKIEREEKWMKKMSREMKERKDPSDFLLPSFDIVFRPSHSSVSDSVRHPSLLIATHPFSLS